jgi:mitochondrial fission protein ELM1
MNVATRRNGDYLETPAADRKRPVIWVLLDGRPGHDTQVIGLANRLEGTIERKQLAFTLLNYVPNPILGPNLVSLTRRSRASLAAPHPDLVIGMGRRIVPAARWIRRQAKGRTRLVLLGRKVATGDDPDELRIRLAHFGQPQSNDESVLLLPPTQVDRQALDRLRTETADPMQGMAKPHILLLVGGPTAHHRFDVDFATRMAGEVADASASAGGGLAIVTSRRTPPAAIAAMSRAAPGAHLHEWRADRQANPYLTYLAHADLIVVTGESESMLAEAAATGKPLTIYPLPPRRPSLKHRLAEWTVARAQGDSAGANVCRGLLRNGWITPPRDLATMHRRMEQRGLAEIFRGRINSTPPGFYADLDAVVRRVRDMIGREPARR